MGSSSRGPIGTVAGEIIRHRNQQSAETDWVDIGSAWLTDKGNISLSIDRIPLAWFGASQPDKRRLVIKLRNGVKIENK